MKKYDILITTFTFPPQQNGVAHVVFKHAQRFVRKGHRITVATEYDPRREGKSIHEGVDIVEFKAQGNANIRSRYSGEIERYKEYIRNFKGDLIICHCWQTWATDIACKVFDRVTAKKILVSHGVSANSTHGWPRSILSWVLWQPYILSGMRKIMKSFDHIVMLSGKADSECFYDRILASRVGYNNISVIPNGADIMQLDSITGSFRSKIGIRDDQRVLLCVGAYNGRKNERMVLDAFIMARPENAVLVFIGNSINKYAIDLVKRWDMHKGAMPTSQVLFMEKLHIEDILSAYKCADLFLCGAKWECFPLVILDAMASGVPFISNNVGCVAELPGGLVVRSANEMAESINKLLSDKTMLFKLGEQGRTACVERYNWDCIADQYLKLFDLI